MREFWVWGAPQSIGIEIGVDLLVPIDVDELVKDVSAGTDYTLSILEDGSTIVDGYINDPEDYQGHFACGCESLGLETGVNSKTISSVVDLDDTVIDAPEWEKVLRDLKERLEKEPSLQGKHEIIVNYVFPPRGKKRKRMVSSSTEVTEEVDEEQEGGRESSDESELSN